VNNIKVYIKGEKEFRKTSKDADRPRRSVKKWSMS
jgi:hypothetical protein